MADPFDLETDAQRRVVLGALAVYLVLFVVELSTDSALAAGAADLLLATLVVAGSLFALRRMSGGETETVALAAVVAFLVAGVTIAYEGLATLGVLPPNTTVQGVGTLALLAGLLLYFFGVR